MSNEVNTTVNTVTAKGADASKYDPSKLPEVAYFRVQSRGLVGTYKGGLSERKVGAWTLLVSCRDGKGLRLATDVAFEYGMKFRGEFKSCQEAHDAGHACLKKWGKAVEKKAPKAKGPTKAELEKQAAEQAARIAQLEAMLKAQMA